MNLRITISDGVSPQLQSAMRMLTSSGLRDLHQAAGTEVQRITVDHIAKIAATRHATAENLGAAPTNHFAQAAEKVAGASALSAGPAGATLTINHPGFARAFRSVKIVPRAAQSLALAIHAISYGHRAGELWDRMHLFIPKGKRIIAATIGGVLTPLYALCKSVTQKQDRSLLPSDAEFQDAAVAGAKGYLGMLIGKSIKP
jgi:hypothetical protein